MVRNHKLARSIADDAPWSELAHKCDWRGKVLVKVDKLFPSSQLYSKCGHQNVGAKDLSVRGWTCLKSGAHHDRDINAAKNILREGMRMLAG